MDAASFWLGVLASIIGSLVFLFLVLLLFKPKIKISPFVSKYSSPFEGEGIVFYIKIVNRSLFNAYDIKAELYMLERYPTPPAGMMNVRATPLSLVSGQLSSLDRYLPLWMRKAADHCIRFRTLDDLEQILADERKSVEFRVILRHGLTGLSKVHSQEYSDLSEIRNGRFTYGPSFGILN